MFAGGTIAKFPWDWTVVCAAHSLEKERGREFAAACSILGARPVMLDLEYGGKQNRSGIDEEALGAGLRKALGGQRFDLALTHNPQGEYGSLDHSSVNRVVRAWGFPELWEFGFNQSQCDISIRLSQRDLEAKKQALRAYRSQSQRIVLVELRCEERFLWS